jgi:dnd system-associated protein 4
MDRRIAAPKGKDMEALLERLTTRLPGENFALFETKQKALMFAAGLGHRLGRRSPVPTRDASTAIRFDIFEKANDDGFIYALAVAEEGELRILAESREDELITIFEEFAHSGLEEINRRCFLNATSDPLDALVAMISSAREVLPVASDNLPGMDGDILRGLLA